MLDGLGQQVDHAVVTTEAGEVLEREIDGAPHRPAPAQGTEFVELSLAAAHARSIHRRADVLLH